MKRLFMTFAAMLLVSVSAFAQSGNNEPLKGDVNGDGVVDEEDIAAVIDIIKNNGGPQVTYYWYAGQTVPTSTSTVTTTTSYDNGGGWFELGTKIPDTIRQLVKGGNSELNWYAAVPITNGSTLKPVAGDMTTLDTSVSEYSTITIGNISYIVYYFGGFTAARNTFAFAKK
ncbi:MAG: hypothetical protein IJ537_09285 [Bacteroidaceae bacterium]|nr:hypothetical protein [Bacteroidaceae bacterium]